MSGLTHAERARHFIIGSKLVPEEMTHDDVVRGLAYEFGLVAQEAEDRVVKMRVHPLLDVLRTIRDGLRADGHVWIASGESIGRECGPSLRGYIDAAIEIWGKS